MDEDTVRSGGCACGAVRFTVIGAPRRGGICHCMTCRKAHASAFNPFVVFDPGRVEITGQTGAWESSPGYVRRFCSVCGSRVVAENQAAGQALELELSLGNFDETGWFSPQYESWTLRREPWLGRLSVPQHDRDRPVHDGA